MTDTSRELPDLDISRPNAARMYDYYLGGAANFAVDREAAEEVIRRVPVTRLFARATRAFLVRVVTHLCQAGVDQFLDLGSGVPTVDNVHEVAARHNPAARVAYVDHEPVAVAHARHLLGEDHPRVSVTQADIRDPHAVLAASGVAGLLDFTRPVGVLAVAVLHFVADADNPAGMMATYRQACVPGSALAVSHIAAVTLTDQQRRGGEAMYATTATPGWVRSQAEIAALLPGYTLADPGLVLLDNWHPTRPVDDEQAAAVNSYGGLGWL